MCMVLYKINIKQLYPKELIQIIQFEQIDRGKQQCLILRCKVQQIDYFAKQEKHFAIIRLDDLRILQKM
ncbi:unnamed protein product [Paramecium sonneborni]|uniref:Uncharacterized protein n=1 Tax=Paramecium sonneborni TaxID=65129 RepID=A0A8S1N967_9CILI|nr:unnamed protein product [Paramecium sonneborni]